MKDTKKTYVKHTAPKPLAKLTMVGTDVKAMEAYTEVLRTTSLKTAARYSGPISLKTKILKLNTRRASSGEGSGTRFYYTKKIWKKCMYIYSEKIISYVLYGEHRAQSIKVELELI